MPQWCRVTRGNWDEDFLFTWVGIEDAWLGQVWSNQDELLLFPVTKTVPLNVIFTLYYIC